MWLMRSGTTEFSLSIAVGLYGRLQPGPQLSTPFSWLAFLRRAEVSWNHTWSTSFDLYCGVTPGTHMRPTRSYSGERS